MKPWVTAELRHEINAKYDLRSLASRTKKQDDFEAFRKQRCKVAKLTKELRRTFFERNPDKEQYWLAILAQEFMASSHYCDMCERPFENEDELENHEDEHQTCGIDGCTFVASPNVSFYTYKKKTFLERLRMRSFCRFWRSTSYTCIKPDYSIALSKERRRKRLPNGEPKEKSNPFNHISIT